MKKRLMLLALLLCLVTATSCTSKAESVFKTGANNYFETFKTEQTAGKNKTEFEYNKEGGSVALSYPVTNNKELDADIREYCDELTADFAKNSQKGDSLYISYRSYNPAKNVYGVEVHSRASIGENTEDTVELFNFDGALEDGDPFNDDLKKMVRIEARELLRKQNETASLAKLKKARPESMLFAADGVIATFEKEDVFGEGEGDISVTVPYTMLYNYLPKTLQEVTAKPERFVDISKKLVALTYDDGPHNTYTNKILDTLEKHGSVATFFEVGQLVSQGADTIKRADELGCEIASHTWSHANLQTSPLATITSQIQKADDAIKEVTGTAPSLLRPPYGATGKTLLANTDKYLIGWSVDTLDWMHRDADHVYNAVVSEGNLDGECVLMHSLYESTAKATERIVPYLIDNGYQLVTVSELIKYKNEDFLESGKYYTYNYFD